jgi:hypothetical protein
VDRHFGLWLAPPDSREKGLQRQVGRHAGLGGPTDHAAREQIDHDRQIQPAFVGLDVGDVRHPDLVGRIDLELPIQGVGCDNSRLSTISSGTALVADLGGDARKTSQPGDTILGNLFPLIAQIVSELAVAIDLATVRPGLPDQLGLTFILPRARRLNGSLSHA